MVGTDSSTTVSSATILQLLALYTDNKTGNRPASMRGTLLTASLMLYLPVGALHTAAPADLRVGWRRSGGDEGEQQLGTLLRTLAEGCEIALVLSAADVHLDRVTLTRKQAKHLHRVLPFVLEEALLDEVAAVSFAASAVDNGCYAVAAAKSTSLARLAEYFLAAGMRLDSIAVDADLLASASPCVAELGDEVLLVREPACAIVVAVNDLALYLEENAADSLSRITSDTLLATLAEALEHKHIELLQRQWQLKNRGRKTAVGGLWGHWRATLVAAAILLVLIWASLGVQYGYYRAAADSWQTRSASLFQRLFPQDRATAKLRAQFRSHLARLGRQGGSVDFLSLMQKAGPVLAAEKTLGVNPKRIQYDDRNQMLLLDIRATNYTLLQELRNKLQAAGLSADISVAKTRTDGVSARIKVGQG